VHDPKMMITSMSPERQATCKCVEVAIFNQHRARLATIMASTPSVLFRWCLEECAETLLLQTILPGQDSLVMSMRALRGHSPSRGHVDWVE
jgi:hypothetical protein